MINVNNFKGGISFMDKKGDIFVVIEAQHSKQGRGQASVKAKVKNLRTGAIIMKTYTGGDKVDPAHISKVEMDYLYNSGDTIVLMDKNTYEQNEIPLAKIAWELNFLKEGQNVIVRMFENEVLDLELPINVTLKVQSAPEAVKGNTTTNPQKKVLLETNFELEAPMFIKEGENIIVSTQTGKYVGRGGK